MHTIPSRNSRHSWRVPSNFFKLLQPGLQGRLKPDGGVDAFHHKTLGGLGDKLFRMNTVVKCAISCQRGKVTRRHLI